MPRPPHGAKDFTMTEISGAPGPKGSEPDLSMALSLQAAVELHQEPAMAVAADGRLLAANARAALTLGAHGGVGTLFEIVAEDEEAVRELLARVTATTIPVSIPLKLNRNGAVEAHMMRGAVVAGRAARAIALLVATDAEPEPASAGGLRRKAEDLARLNRQLAEAKQRAEEANRSKTEFLARVSHELRTPLNAIIGFSEIMTQELFGAVEPPRYGLYARDILTSGRHLLDLVNDVLDLSKIEAGKMVLREQPIELAVLVTRVLRLVEESARSKGLTLETVLAPDLPGLHADPRAVTQMLLNLLSNAIKFTLSGGSVRIAIRQEDGAMIIEVRDTGIGISPENILRCLEPFDQIDNVLTRRFEGSGLGLAITKALIEMHEGMLRLESRIGVGTTVSLIFPAARSLPLPIAPEAS
jgi:two-component system cell cycle sensor histidine kinase PleC